MKKRVSGAHLLEAAAVAGILIGVHPLPAPAAGENANSVTALASGKFGRGLVNISTGWGEMIRCPKEIMRERGYLLGATWGPLKGIGMTVIRTVSGVCETALFFYPLPGNYDPFLEPEFVWPGTVFVEHGSARDSGGADASP